MIRYLIGDATVPNADGPKIIAHIVNDRGGWGKGFVLALRARYPEAEVAYRRWSRQPAADDPPFRHGAVQFVEVAPTLWIANILAQRGFRSATNPVPLDYAALKEGLIVLAQFAATYHATIHMPRIGAGLAGGDWETIAALMGEHLNGCDVTVYDLA